MSSSNRCKPVVFEIGPGGRIANVLYFPFPEATPNSHISRQLRPLDITTKRNYYRAMDFEWDAAKAALNLRKHGVAFEDAARAFLDVGRLEIHDGREDYGEDRWATIGQVYAAVLYVVYTVRHEDSIRIISARRALSHEQKKYREANA